MSITECLVCRSNQIRLVKTLNAGRFKVFRCDQCTFHFAPEAATADKPVRTDETFYERIIDSFAAQRARARRILPARVASYNELLGRPMKSVLEIGCATGAYAEAFSELGIEYTGIEIEPRLAEIARKTTDRPILCQDFLDYESDRPHDVIFASQVLEHVPQPALFLANSRKVAPDGLLHVDVPNHDYLLAAIRKYVQAGQYGGIQPPYHLLSYNQKSLRTLLSQSGFDLLVLKNGRSDDLVLGQLMPTVPLWKKILYSASDMVGQAGLLIAVARPREHAAH